MKLIEVKWRGSYKDGGTEEYIGEFDGIHYFIDKRINSKTTGQIYDKYPSDKGAKILKGIRLVGSYE